MKHPRFITLRLALLLCVVASCRLGQEYGQDQRLAQIDDIAQEQMQAGNIPGVVVLVGQADRIVYHKAFGWELVAPYREKMTKDTVFDVASLTKPIATATSILVLVDRKRLSLDDYVGQYLPAFACRGKEGVQIKHLLAHSSGLPAYTSADDLAKQHGNPCPDALIEKICSLEARSQPGIEFRYSCLGYIVLAKIVEIVAGQSIRDFTQENIFVPLGMRHTTYNPPTSWQSHTAATEIVNDKLLRGTVHDPLARLMSGAAGNAGLFSSASDLSIYCRMLLNGGVWKDRRILSPYAVSLLTSEQSHGRAYGFDVNSSYSWIKGPYASKDAFCHTGYTGVSLVSDPVTRTYLIILTNRVHPDDKGSDKQIRLKIAELVFQALAKGNSLAQYGYSRDNRPDCKQSLP